jgi:hypothetical protein
MVHEEAFKASSEPDGAKGGHGEKTAEPLGRLDGHGRDVTGVVPQSRSGGLPSVSLVLGLPITSTSQMEGFAC